MIDQRDPSLPHPIRATTADLPRAVATALAAAPEGRPGRVDAAGIRWATVEWGDRRDRPVLLVHGVTAWSGTWWRTGPALAAAGFRVVAIDLPGHGSTGGWSGRHRFADTAADVAAFIRAAGLDSPDPAAVGHSWGAMIVAALPRAGIRPGRLVLLDPPAVPAAVMGTMLDDSIERHYDDIVEAIRAIRGANPSWTEGDVTAKAAGLTLFDVEAVRAVLLDNGDWDGGRAALADPRASGIPTWIVRGEPATGGLIPEAAVPGLARVVGDEHILTIADGPHSPHRTHPEATLVALLRALGD